MVAGILLVAREVGEARDLVHAEIDLVAQRGQSRAREMRPPDDLAPALLLLLTVRVRVRVELGLG